MLQSGRQARPNLSRDLRNRFCIILRYEFVSASVYSSVHCQRRTEIFCRFSTFPIDALVAVWYKIMKKIAGLIFIFFGHHSFAQGPCSKALAISPQYASISSQKLMDSLLHESLPGLPISSLADTSGNIYLFRIIDTKPKFDKPYGRTKRVSYSLSPSISKSWLQAIDAYIIISKLNIFSDEISYVGWTGSRGKVPTKRITMESNIEEGRHFDEVVIEFSTQNPIACMRVADFLNLAKQTVKQYPISSRPYDFFERLISSINNADCI